MQTFDEQGRPQSNGPCHLVNGRLVLRDGFGVGASLMFMDSSGRKAKSAQQGPAGTLEASAPVAKAIRDHTHAHRYDQSPPALDGVNLAVAVTRAAVDQARLPAPTSVQPAGLSPTALIRDTARANRYLPAAPNPREHSPAGNSHQSETRSRAIRNAARASRYASN
jgi:hypothetical protein